ncbi:unknown [Clostridium sp. CAG:264]|jgi:hypothetical protein|nr:unknown [Clostridium sp. CAG:264]
MMGYSYQTSSITQWGNVRRLDVAVGVDVSCNIENTEVIVNERNISGLSLLYS